MLEGWVILLCSFAAGIDLKELIEEASPRQCAAKHAGRVSIALTEQPDALRIDVTDNGPGIRHEDQEMIFEKFRQAGDTLTEKPQGTGLGLPISRQIVNHFGGRLLVQSEPGKGATFSFTVPRCRAEIDVTVLDASDLRPAGVAP